MSQDKRLPADTVKGRGGVPWRAPYAADPRADGRRLHPEAASPHRSPFQRDRDRIVHATAFRRLKHKTQVFVAHEGDHYRTRLTHSLEVAQIARSVARTLGLDEDLTEALALAHDLGHTPFGHAGEAALDAAMAPYGGFDHNGQALRIVTALEQRYAEFDGLNLTVASLDGLIKHNGPLASRRAGPGWPFGIAEIVRKAALDPAAHGGAEAQVAALADDIAYHSHDIDDGLRAKLFRLDELADVPLVGAALDAVRTRYPGLEARRVIHETLRRIIGTLIDDLHRETERRLAALAPTKPEDIRQARGPVVQFSAALKAENQALKQFLFERMYRHERVMGTMAQAQRVVGDLFCALMQEPARQAQSEEARARGVADFIAGMTDPFALDEHARRCGGSLADLRRL